MDNLNAIADKNIDLVVVTGRIHWLLVLKTRQ